MCLAGRNFATANGISVNEMKSEHNRARIIDVPVSASQIDRFVFLPNTSGTKMMIEVIVAATTALRTSFVPTIAAVTRS